MKKMWNWIVAIGLPFLILLVTLDFNLPMIGVVIGIAVIGAILVEAWFRCVLRLIDRK